MKTNIFLICLFLFSVSCTSNSPHWARDPGDASDQATNSKKTNKSRPMLPYEVTVPDSDSRFYSKLRILEYDDNGDKWDPQQIRDVISLIKDSPQAPIIVFFHGWRHDALPTDENLKGFDKFLKKGAITASSYRKKPIGIYIGWRGASIKEEKGSEVITTVPAVVSFLERRPATDRIASIPLASDLWSIRNEAIRNEKKHGIGNRVVFVGHSFGARILERVVSQSVLAYHATRSTHTKKSKPSLLLPRYKENEMRRDHLMADFVLLINNASESMFSRQMKLGLLSWPAYDPPAIISITAQTDGATKGIWKIGKKLEAHLAVFKARPGRIYQLGLNGMSCRTETQASYMEITAGHDPRQISALVNLEKGASEFTFNGSDIPASCHRMGYKEGYRSYVNLRVGCEILHGHGGEKGNNGVFNDEVELLAHYLIRQTNTTKFTSTKLYNQIMGVYNPEIKENEVD